MELRYSGLHLLAAHVNRHAVANRPHARLPRVWHGLRRTHRCSNSLSWPSRSRCRVCCDAPLQPGDASALDSAEVGRL